MTESKRPQSRTVLPIISIVTSLGFLDTHLLIPVMALYAATLGAGVGIIGPWPIFNNQHPSQYSLWSI
jgi:hypothetical protein